MRETAATASNNRVPLLACLGRTLRLIYLREAGEFMGVIHGFGMRLMLRLVMLTLK